MYKPYFCSNTKKLLVNCNTKLTLFVRSFYVCIYYIWRKWSITSSTSNQTIVKFPPFPPGESNFVTRHHLNEVRSFVGDVVERRARSKLQTLRLSGVEDQTRTLNIVTRLTEPVRLNHRERPTFPTEYLYKRAVVESVGILTGNWVGVPLEIGISHWSQVGLFCSD